MDSIRYEEKADSLYRILVIYFILFLAAWSFREIVLPPYLSGLPETVAALEKAALKIMVWIVPVWLLGQPCLRPFRRSGVRMDLQKNRFALVCHHPSLVPQLLFDHHVKKLKDAPPSLSFFMFPPPDNRRRSVA